jgi:hypothetical protein
MLDAWLGSMKSISYSAAAAHPMAASVAPDGGHHISQHLLIDRFLGSRQPRVKVRRWQTTTMRGATVQISSPTSWAMWGCGSA